MKNQSLGNEYTARINRVIDYIEQNLDRPMTLEELAGVANFSKYHFHRIFAAQIGETLNQFIQRIRIERAAGLLVNNPDKSIIEVAFDCGFSGYAPFARAFRDTFGMSASRWRSCGHLESKIGQTDRKDCQPVGNPGKAFQVCLLYLGSITQPPRWRIEMKEKNRFHCEVTVRDCPEMTAAYVRHVGSYAGNEALFKGLFDKLLRWAGPRNLLRFPETKSFIIYHDNPEITEEEKLRISVCITVPEDTQVGGEIGKMTIPAGKYGIGHFELSADEFGEAWNALYAGWLPESGYQPDDRPCFELCLNDPKEHPEHKTHRGHLRAGEAALKSRLTGKGPLPGTPDVEPGGAGAVSKVMLSCRLSFSRCKRESFGRYLF
ncbi:MAG TPA: AraC family transcriptional regulator [bacterium]|nr:AraC family transcriptional regulator [bacterium]